MVGLVSGFGFLGRGGFGNDFGFFGLVLVDLAGPLCVIRTKLDSILMNNFWFKSGWGFGFIFGMGLGLVFLVSWFILGVLGDFVGSECGFSVLLFLFGVLGGFGVWWGQANLPLGPPLVGCPGLFSLACVYLGDVGGGLLKPVGTWFSLAGLVELVLGLSILFSLATSVNFVVVLVSSLGSGIGAVLFGSAMSSGVGVWVVCSASPTVVTVIGFSSALL